MKHLTHSFIIIVVLLAASCSDAPYNPINKEKPGVQAPETFGLVEVTITGIGSEQMSASVKPFKANTAYALTEPGGGTGDGTIQIEPISNGSFTYGERSSGGVRYIYATFKVRNAEIGGTPYSSAIDNLTFLAVDNAATYGTTAISELRLFDGTLLTGATAENFATQMFPTGWVGYVSGDNLTIAKPDVLQIFTETEVGSITMPAGVTTVFPYGFVTRSPEVTASSRQLPVTPAAPVQYDGLVTFAFQIPLEAAAAQDPFEIKMIAMPVEDSEVHVTQSLEEQTPNDTGNFIERVNTLTGAAATVLPGANITAAISYERICSPVRISGPFPLVAGSNTFLFPTPPVYQNFIPGPYHSSGNTDQIDHTTAFKIYYNPGPKPANAYNFMVNGSQSGRWFLGGGYINSALNVEAPAGNFMPGEIVEVTGTPGLGGCAGKVARYRVEVAPSGSSGTFAVGDTPGVGTEPRAITSGDWNGDGNLDLATANTASDDVTIIINGAGGTSTISVGDFPNAIVAGDWDIDGDIDLAVSNRMDDNISILINDGAGNFTESITYAVGSQPRDITVGDLDADGDLDLAVAKYTEVTVMENDGTGVFVMSNTLSLSGSPGINSIISGDLDSDLDIDLATANSATGDVSVLMNDGTSVFTETARPGVGTNPFDITIGDFDADGDLDLATSNQDSDDITVLKNGNGSFGIILGFTTSLGAGTGPASITSGDWDGDGDIDLATANLDLGAVSELFNDGNGAFPTIATDGVTVGSEPRAIISGDWDGDSDLDIAVAKRGTDNVTILENN